MKIQVNTDVATDGNQAAAAQVRATVEQALARFKKAVTCLGFNGGDALGHA